MEVERAARTTMNLTQVIDARAQRLRDLAGREDLSELLQGLDGKALGESLTALADALLKLAAAHPELARELEPAAADAIRAADFGKLRVALVALADNSSRLAEGCVSEALVDPVTFANIFGALVPLLNDLLGLAAHLVEKVDLPDEILAGAVFNMLDELDAGRIARLLNAMAARINELHNGSLILGRDEPRFRQVWLSLNERIAAGLNTQELAGALAALAQDLEVVLEVWAGMLVTDPKLRGLVADAAAGWRDAALRCGSNVLRTLEIQPAQLARTTLSPERVGKTIDDGLAAFIRWNEKSNDGIYDYARRLLAQIEPGRLETALRSVLSSLIRALLADARRASAALRPLAAAGWSLLKFPLKQLWRRLRSGRQEGSTWNK